MRIAGLVVILGMAPLAGAQSPCEAHAMSNQARIAQKEIQTKIDQTVEAAAAKDFPAKMHYFTPDFTLRLSDGKVLDRAQFESDLKRDMDWILSVSDETTTRVDCVQLRGREATAWTSQHYVRTVPDRKDGSPHELITNVTHRETWIYSDQGWLTRRIEVLKEGPVFLDGKPYDN